ncbi:hypothetical protein F2Q68_00018650 [Brassica cretica]|uniref:Leucine-rich repeat-containing N-terminal plant-type domain-containing protein n=1 Tax=Brassica cretica TaxID=69181 RepID=A0A8S9FTJ3_BRACR|nr:hypothetical protein F2Q68_00018650 [Brassica cretica]
MRFAPLSLVPVLLLLLRWEQPFTEAMINPVDFLALQAIRKSLDDLPGSNFFDSWDFTGDPCSFAGVYCDGDNVTALNLGDPRAGSPEKALERSGPSVGGLNFVVTEVVPLPKITPKTGYIHPHNFTIMARKQIENQKKTETTAGNQQKKKSKTTERNQKKKNKKKEKKSKTREAYQKKKMSETREGNQKMKGVEISF